MIQPRGAANPRARSIVTRRRAEAGARPLGPHRDWRQPGDRRGGVRTAGGGGREHRHLESLAGGRRRRASLLIALCFAEVASRFEGTGGPYLYTRAAFGRFAAFEVGWLLWFTRAASWASVINVLVASLGFYWPAITRAGRARR